MECSLCIRNSSKHFVFMNAFNPYRSAAKYYHHSVDGEPKGQRD